MSSLMGNEVVRPRNENSRLVVNNGSNLAEMGALLRVPPTGVAVRWIKGEERAYLWRR